MSSLKKEFTYWECTKDGHSKFWAATIQEIERNINAGGIIKQKTFFAVVRRWGMIGTTGQSMQQEFNSRYDAEQILNTLIWDKQRKGYVGIF
jgi:predicted DNA-binding WGR domain protein